MKVSKPITSLFVVKNDQAAGYTNTRAFASQSCKATARLKVRKVRVDANLAIGSSHGGGELGKCLQNMRRATVRNTDIIFGVKDPDLHSDHIGQSHNFKLTNQVANLGKRITREQAGRREVDT